jgi:pilus assembly protein Flp/PilA
MTERARQKLAHFSSPSRRISPLEPQRATGDIVMRALLCRFATDQSGATSIEYGLIASGVALAIITVVTGLGTGLNTKFKSISTQLK